jgi:hypothetical protein
LKLVVILELSAQAGPSFPSTITGSAVSALGMILGDGAVDSASERLNAGAGGVFGAADACCCQSIGGC